MINIRLLKIIVCVFLIVTVKDAYCVFQPSYDNPVIHGEVQRSKFYVGLCLGMTSYYGDIVNNNMDAPFYYSYGAQINVEREIYKSTRICIGFFSGNILGDERTTKRNLNFKTSILAPQLGISCKFLNLFHKRFATYIFGGIEEIFFSPSGDIKNSKGGTYYYWNDGSIRNLPENLANQNSAAIIKRDYIYETNYRNLNLDNVSSYPQSTIGIPLGLSAEANLNNGFTLRAGAIFHYTFTDYIDNITVNSVGSRKGNAATDKFLFSYIGVFYNLPVPTKKHTPITSCGFLKSKTNHNNPKTPKF
jgi:hypothetical protein